jgi:hypothetical protein
MSTLPLVSRTFWSRGVTALELAPMVLVEATRHLAFPPTMPWEPSVAERAYHRVRSDVRDVELPPAAEDALDDFIDHCLDGSPSGESVPAPVFV